MERGVRVGEHSWVYKGDVSVWREVCQCRM